MNQKLKTLAIGLLCAGVAFAGSPANEQPGEWHAHPVTNFSGEVQVANSVAGEEISSISKSRPAKIKRQVAQADASLFEGRTLYGCLISSDTWAGMSITEVPYGLYSFTIGNNPSPAAHITDMGYGFKGGAWGRDTYYGIVPLSLMGMLNGSRHIQIDTKNWVEKSNVMHDREEGSYSLICCAMAYDPTDDTFYAFRYKEDLSGLDWVKVNPETSQFEMIAAYRGKTIVLTLAPTPDGTMYYIDGEGDLYTVNKENGRTSLVGNTGVSPTAYDQCMMYDNRSGSFLWAALSDEGSVLYSVDPATAETKRVAKFKNNEQFVTLYTTASDALPGAPGAPVRPQLKYSSNGALDGTITFTTPSKTFSGENLSGKVNLDVWLDGENLKGEEVEAGTAINIPVTLEEGNHYINITTSNEIGFSPMRYIYQYAGYDTPVAPGSPRMEFVDNINKVTWSTPEGGVNKGYVDFDNLTYDVVRMPGNVKVATGIKETSFSEPTPESLQAYYYCITAINNGHVSATAETNRVLCGDAFPVPYSQSFEDEATFNDFFKVVDNDGDGNSWRYGYSGEIRMDYIKNGVDADDWLILPKVSMQQGVKYRFSMLMKIFTQTYPEDFEILIGTNPDDLSSFKSIAKETDFTRIANEFDDYICDFVVDAAGDYNIAIRYCSKLNKQNSLLMVRNVGISVVGMADAPAQVSDMAISPNADDLLEATISFKAPEKTLIDEPLSSIAKISIYRNSEENPIHVFENVTPGEYLSWIDKNVPSVGIHAYTVVASNEAGDGEFCTEESFVGIYTVPYFTDFSDKKYSRALWATEDNITDNDNGSYGWTWKEDANGNRFFDAYYYLMENKPTEIWLFSPKFKMEDNTVYTINYNALIPLNYGDKNIKWQIACGENASIDSMNKIEDIEGRSLTSDFETMLVNKNGGRYNIGFGASASQKFDYIYGSINNFSLTRRASAFAPYRISDYKSEADQSGQLKTTLEFKTPNTDYFSNKLDASEKLTVKIYQGKDVTIPSFTTEAAPGELVKWVDEKALHGFNYYRITCENSYGPGEAVLDTIFVGRDKPALIENLNFKADAQNANVRLNWDKPERGVNGGLVLDSETKYNVYAYNPLTQELTPIAENVAEKTYLVEANVTGAQNLYYYAISAVNSEGEGTANATSVVLGKLYDLPFEESFANSAVSTQLWQAIPMIDGATSAGISNPEPSYNQCEGPQDNDGGCAYIYNGYQFETYVGALLVTPKMHLVKDGKNELSFWAYHYKEPADYVNKGAVYIAVSADDTEAEIVTGFEVGGDQETGWTEHKVNLDKYKDADHLSIIFMGMTPGYQDAIYIDNIKVASGSSSVDGVLDEDQRNDSVIYDLNGYRLPGNGVSNGKVVISNGKKSINR